MKAPDSSVFAVTPAGHRIYVDPADPRAQRLVEREGNFVPGSMALWQAGLRLQERWTTVVDVGANYGEMTVSSVETLPYTPRVVAFEPNPTVAEHLRQTVAELPAPVEVIEVAVGAEAADAVEFTVDAMSSGQSFVTGAPANVDRLPERVYDGRYVTRSVALTTLDDYFTQTADLDPLLIKIDVEGLEDQVLAGATRLFSEVDRVAFMMEVLHFSIQHIWHYVQRHPTFAVDTATGRLLRLTPRHPHQLARVLHANGVHRNDLLFLAGKDVEAFTAEVMESDSVDAAVDPSEQAETASKEAARLTGEVRRLTDVVKHLTDECAARTTLAGSLSERADRLDHELQSVRALLQARDAALSNKDAELATARDHAASLERSAAELRGQVRGLSKEIDTYRASRAYRLARHYGDGVRALRRLRALFRG